MDSWSTLWENSQAYYLRPLCCPALILRRYNGQLANTVGELSNLLSQAFVVPCTDPEKVQWIVGQHRGRTLKPFQIGASLYAVGRPVRKRNDEDGQIGTIQSLPLERGALFNRFFGEPAHGPPHVAGGASGPIGGCQDESRTDNPDLDLRHVFDKNNRKTDLI